MGGDFCGGVRELSRIGVLKGSQDILYPELTFRITKAALVFQYS